MKLRNLFYLLLALPLFFAGCTENGVDGPNKAETTLNLTSEASLTFKAEGGKGTIAYKLENAVDGVKLSASCDADWVTDLIVGNNITFNVAANEGDARRTKIVVAYQDKSFEVAINQEAYVPAVDYLYNETMAYASRIDLSEYGYPTFYYLIAFYSEDGNILLGTVLVGDEGESILSSGTYNVANGGLMLDGFELYIGDEEEYYFEGGDGEIIVGGDIDGYTFDIKLVDDEGNNFHFTYEGAVEGMNILGDLPTEPVNLTVDIMAGEYYGTEFSDSHSYFVILSDLGYDEEGYALPGGTYYQLDLYAVKGAVDANGYISIPAGTYTVDLTDSMADWTMSSYYSGFYKISADGMSYDARAGFESGEAVVTENGITLTVFIGGVQHTVVYNGETKLYAGEYGGGETPAPSEDTEFTAYVATGTYYGDQYTPGVADNYYFYLSDLGFDADGYAQAGGTYYRFDIYAPITSDMTITPGTYYIDINDTMDLWTVSAYYSAYFKVNGDASDYEAVDYPVGGFITFNEDNTIYAEVEFESGATHKVSFSGDIVIMDGTYNDGGEGGGDYGDTLTMLEGDYTCAFDHHVLLYEGYGDYYGIGLQNWVLSIAPNDGEGDCVQFDILAGADSTDFAGTYAISGSFGSYTAYPGEVSGGYIVGSWYYTADYSVMAPFIDGTVWVTNNGNGTYTVAFTLYDDAYNFVEGTWTGEALDYGAMSTRSAGLKQAKKFETKKVVAEKTRLEVKAKTQSVKRVATKGLKLR